MKKIESVANFFAKLLHPVLLFGYVFFAYAALAYPKGILNLYRELLYTLIFTIFFPILSVWLSSKDLYINASKPRRIPLFFTAMSYTACMLLLILPQINPYLKMYIWVMSVGLWMIFGINFFYKISLHSTGITAFLFFSYWILKSYQYPYTNLIVGKLVIVCSFVLWQRINSKSHTVIEVASGIFLTLLICIYKVMY